MNVAKLKALSERRAQVISVVRDLERALAEVEPAARLTVPLHDDFISACESFGRISRKLRIAKREQSSIEATVIREVCEP